MKYIAREREDLRRLKDYDVDDDWFEQDERRLKEIRIDQERRDKELARRGD